MIADNETVPVTKSTFKEVLARDGKMCSVDDPDYLAYVSKLRRGERCRIARRRAAMRAKTDAQARVSRPIETLESAEARRG